MKRNIDEIMKEIYLYGFSRDDTALFLDTHPDCTEALNHFKRSTEKYENAVQEAAAYGNPMFQSQGASDCSWNWIDRPWPWEGGCK